MEELFISIEKAANLLNVSKSTAYNMVHAGLIPVVQWGRLKRVPVKALKRLAEEAMADQFPVPYANKSGDEIKESLAAGGVSLGDEEEPGVIRIKEPKHPKWSDKFPYDKYDGDADAEDLADGLDPTVVSPGAI